MKIPPAATAVTVGMITSRSSRDRTRQFFSARCADPARGSWLLARSGRSAPGMGLSGAAVPPAAAGGLSSRGARLTAARWLPRAFLVPDGPSLAPLSMRPAGVQRHANARYANAAAEPTRGAPSRQDNSAYTAPPITRMPTLTCGEVQTGSNHSHWDTRFCRGDAGILPRAPDQADEVAAAPLCKVHTKSCTRICDLTSQKPKRKIYNAEAGQPASNGVASGAMLCPGTSGFSALRRPYAAGLRQCLQLGLAHRGG